MTVVSPITDRGLAPATPEVSPVYIPTVSFVSNLATSLAKRSAWSVAKPPL